MAILALIIFFQAGTPNRLSDLALSHRVVSDVTTLSPARGSDFGSSIETGTLTVSDDGTTLFVIYAWHTQAYDLKTFRKYGGDSVLGYESILCVVYGGPSWKILAVSDSQFQHLDPQTRHGSVGRGGKVMGSLGGWRLHCLVGHAMPLAGPRGSQRVGYLYGVAEIRFEKRGPKPNPTFELPGAPHASYRFLGARLDDAKGARLLFARFESDNTRRAALQYYLMTGEKLVRLQGEDLSAEERQVDGRTFPCFTKDHDLSNLPDNVLTLRPSHFDLRNRVVLFDGPYVYELDGCRIRKLRSPSPDKKWYYWKYHLIGGRIYSSLWSRSPFRVELHEEEKPGVWKYLGPYRIVGMSANERYLVVSRPDKPVDNPPTYVIELLH